jgi:hypothetical protein
VHADKTRYRYRLELLSSFLFKFVVALRAEAQLPVDPRLAPSAAPQAERYARTHTTPQQLALPPKARLNAVDRLHACS